MGQQTYKYKLTEPRILECFRHKICSFIRMNAVLLWRTSTKLKEPNIDIFDNELHRLLFRLAFLLFVLLFVSLLVFILGMDGSSL